MNLRFHRAVQSDLNEVLDYYAERSLTAPDRFWEDVHQRFKEIAENPEQFGFIHPARGLRRVRLRQFPYVILYYVSNHGVRVTCVKHEKRHPLVGLMRR